MSVFTAVAWKVCYIAAEINFFTVEIPHYTCTNPKRSKITFHIVGTIITAWNSWG